MLTWAAGLACLVLAQGPPDENPYLKEAARQLRALDERAALSTLARAESWAKDKPEALATVNVYKGMAFAGLNQKKEAIDAFRTALLLDPQVRLLPDASPVVRGWWAEGGGGAAAAPAPVEARGSAEQHSGAWWIPSALAVAFAASAAICYAESLSKYNALTGPASLGPIDPGTEARLHDQGVLLQNLAWVGAGAAVAAAGTAAWLRFGTDGKSSVGIALRPTLGPVSVGVRGTFP